MALSLALSLAQGSVRVSTSLDGDSGASSDKSCGGLPRHPPQSSLENKESSKSPNVDRRTALYLLT